MSESKSSENQSDPSELLKKEALAERPAFSQDLHDRVCAAIREESHDRTSDGRQPLRAGGGAWASRQRRFVSAAAACTIVVAAGVLWWSHASREGDVLPVDSPNPLATLADAAGQTTVEAGQAAESVLVANQWGRLDEDAQTAAKMVLNSLPLNMLARKSDGS